MTRGRQNSKTILNILYPFLTVVVMIAVWQIAAAAIDEVFILPSPTSTVKEIFRLMGLSNFWGAYASTLLRSLLGFVLSFVLAAVLALSATLCEPLRRLYSPLIGFLRSLPTMAAVLLLSVWTSSKTTTIIIALLVIMPSLYASFYSALNATNAKLITMSKVFKVSKHRQIVKLYLPHALPIAAYSCAGAISLNLKLVIAAEILAVTAKSLGSQMLLAKNYLEIPTLLALNLVAAATGMILEYGLSALLKVIMKRRKSKAVDNSSADNKTSSQDNGCLTIEDAKAVDNSSTDNKTKQAKDHATIEGTNNVDNSIIDTDNSTNNVSKITQKPNEIRLNNITKKFGDKAVYQNLNLNIYHGEITAIMGASGCGKTTLLNMLAGLEDYDGEIEGVGNCSYIFQEARLIPYMTARQNIQYATSHQNTQNTTANATDNRVDELLKSVGLEDAMDTYADNLSIGMAQRVSFVRAFAFDADMVLMDEPFRGLDVSLKSRLMQSFKRLWNEDKRACIMVTHEIDEAIEISDRIVVFKEGKAILDNNNKLNPMTHDELREFLIVNT